MQRRITKNTQAELARELILIYIGCSGESFGILLQSHYVTVAVNHLEFSCM